MCVVDPNNCYDYQEIFDGNVEWRRFTTTELT